MNWEALGAVAELLGAIAVFATLFYLAKQIKHTFESQDRANEIALASSVAESNQLFLNTWEQLTSNAELADIYHRAIAGERLDPAESIRYVALQS